MSNQSPYEQLGVTEAASFEEIQEARNRLHNQHQGDRKQLEAIETAYDAVLMERLRMRQEGKIKVPERIRFPEKTVQPAVSPLSSPTRQPPEWLRRFSDQPSTVDIVLPGVILTALSLLVLFVPTPQVLQGALLLGVGSSFYFLFRKERKFGRSVLLSLGGLILGFAIGSVVSHLLQVQIAAVGLNPASGVIAIAFLLLWVISSFLR